MKKIVLLIGFMAGIAPLWSIASGTEPKTKDPRKDSASQKQHADIKGFKNLFTSDNFNPSQPYSLQINPKAVPFIEDYMARHRNHLEGMREWARPYFRMMDNILGSYGLPRELKYLAVIESNLQNTALSWAGARGPWQFMPQTAREYGLQVSGTRDERTDYYRSTHAAARYLKVLYDQLGGDWLLVIAAYNGGPGKVFSAIKRTGTRDFWKLQHALPLESRNHVKKFIATHYVMEGTGGVTTVTSKELETLHEKAIEAHNAQLHVRSNLPVTPIEGTTTQKIQGKYNSMVLANTLSLDITEFNKLNPSFDKLVQEEEGYMLRLPDEKMQQFNAARYQILQQSIMVSLQSVSQTPEGFPEPKKPAASAPAGVKKKKQA